jgi:uncharacterized linocin/CFP29 family protein
MTTDIPQVPWTDEQWARLNQVVQEEASRARVAATFLPLVGPLPRGTDFVRRELISYPDVPAQQRPPLARIAIDDRNIWQLSTLQVKVSMRGAQIADPDMSSALALFRRAANVVARLEDAVVFRGLEDYPIFPEHFRPRGGVEGLQAIWEIRGGEGLRGLLDGANVQIPVGAPPPPRGRRLVQAVSIAIGRLEAAGHFGPFALALDNDLFALAQSPDPDSLVLPQDRIIPFLGGGSLLRASTLPHGRGVIVALGGSPVELVVARDMCLEFLQHTSEPNFLFRVHERLALRVKEPSAIVTLVW